MGHSWMFSLYSPPPPKRFVRIGCTFGIGAAASLFFLPPTPCPLCPLAVALQVAFERQTLKPVFSLDRL
jgi:hypothetical protein